MLKQNIGKNTLGCAGLSIRLVLLSGNGSHTLPLISNIGGYTILSRGNDIAVIIIRYNIDIV